MVDFGHLRQHDVRADSTADYALVQISTGEKTPTLVLRPATEVNRPYFNALLKRTSKRARLLSAGNLNSSMLEENRAEDRALYPQYVVTGWRDVVDAGGEEVKFSKEAAADFVQALPDWVFDDVAAFARNPQNFAGGPVDAEDVAKN
jgi:hypothetical protein